MAKKAKKDERKIKDLKVDTQTGEQVKGGSAATPPSRRSIYRRLNEVFRPKS